MQETSSCIGLCISSSMMLTSESDLEARTVKEEGLTYHNHSKRLYCLNISHLGIISSALIDTVLMLLAPQQDGLSGAEPAPASFCCCAWYCAKNSPPSFNAFDARQISCPVRLFLRCIHAA